MSGVPGQVVVALIGEALQHFGSITDQNKAEVTRYVQRRARELADLNAGPKPYEPAGFDHKQAQLGEREE